MPFEIFQVDAFSGVPFRGNPAAVVPLESWPDDEWLQAVAAENNLSETAYFVPDAAGTFALRWFTPTTEVALCGHATVATAHVLWETGRLDVADAARFDTQSGRVTATAVGDGWIELDFPALMPERIDPPTGLAAALGMPESPWEWVGRSRFDVLVRVASPCVVAALSPDFGALGAIEARGVIVTAAGGPDGVDFCSRFFAPNAGVNEDPVTGSAHCVLTPYWAGELGKARLSARQISARGGELRLELRGDRVGLAGQAVTVLRGTLL